MAVAISFTDAKPEVLAYLTERLRTAAGLKERRLAQAIEQLERDEVLGALGALRYEKRLLSVRVEEKEKLDQWIVCLYAYHHNLHET